MRLLKVLLVLVIVQLLIGLETAYPETIYTKDGKEIQAKIAEITEDTIWVETTVGDIAEYNGIDKSGVEKILNNNGSISKYSPTYYKKEGAKSGQNK